MATKSKNSLSIALSLSYDKPIGAVKLDTDYRGYCLKEDQLHFTIDVYSSPLRAANAARQLEKTLRNSTSLKEAKKPDKVTKLVKKILFTENELREANHSPAMKLRFRERWVIISPTKLFVGSPKNSREILSLTEDRNEAQLFNTYEAAMDRLKVLDMVIKKGHNVTRFFEDTWA